jgi:hypothetical protein
MKLSSIGQRTRCAMPEPFLYLKLILSNEKRKIHVLLDHKIPDQRERQDDAV